MAHGDAARLATMTSKVRSDPTIDAFMLAAARGSQVSAWRTGDRIQAGAQAPSGNPADTAALLVQALRDAFGEAAGDSAELTLSSATRRGSALPASLVRRLIESAEASHSLLQGATFGLRVRFSAVTSGAGFRACCEALGIDPHTMPFERRRDIDAQLAARLAQTASPSAEAVAECLRAVLAERPH